MPDHGAAGGAAGGGAGGAAGGAAGGIPSRQRRNMHRLLVNRLHASATAAYDARVRKAAPRTVPMRYSIDRIVWVLRTGAQWYLMESKTGSWQTHYQRFRRLAELGVFDAEFEKVGLEYVARRGSVARVLIDGTHIKARKGGPCTGRSPVDRGKCGSKMTVLTDDQSVPRSATFCAGNVSASTQLIPTLEAARTQYGNLARFGELCERSSRTRRTGALGGQGVRFP